MLWIDGFDECPTAAAAYLMSAGYLIATASTTVTGRGGKGKALSVGAGTYFTKVLGSQTSLFMGFGYKNTDTLMNADVLVFGADVSEAIVSRLKVTRTVSNALSIKLDGVTIATTAAEVFQQNVWCYIELAVQLSGATSTVVLKVNNVQKIAASFDGTGLVIDRATFKHEGSAAAYFDDIYIFNAAGSTNNTLVGDVFVENMTIGANYTPINWTPVGSSLNYQNINEVSVADDLQYNVAASVGARDMFSMKEVSVLTNDILGVMMGLRTKKVGTGAAQVSLIMSYGGTEVIAPAFSPDADFTTRFVAYDQTPKAADWTVAVFNAMKVGYELVG